MQRYRVRGKDAAATAVPYVDPVVPYGPPVASTAPARSGSSHNGVKAAALVGATIALPFVLRALGRALAKR